MSSARNRYLLVHGHFYQPPRENPWIDAVETQDSAAPYHDWNDRITAECYARNGASRILNRADEIVSIVNNYAGMSFNFGPTLLSWLETHGELTYASILEGDRLSAERFSGHGSAIAQVYNHVIMPLASRRDKELQVRWGIADFVHRFQRKPEGMWLAETAVDTETLEVLAEHGILFTILAPAQCAAVRPLASAEKDRAHAPDSELSVENSGWTETLGASVDTRHAYRVELSEGRSIAVFFYDGPRSRAIAFERLLDSGVGFAQRLASGFSGAHPAHPELVHVATDGESYGHHHRYGEMALSYALRHIEKEKLARITNYGEFLERFPPRWSARITENTSWSCAHGVERWRSDCGCNGGRAGWNQRWRGPLRAALDSLRDGFAPLMEERGRAIFRDWEETCSHYVAVMLERHRATRFLREHSSRSLSRVEMVEALRLLELVRHLQLMYTSCGWFFDDISGIETVQIIAYAARALELGAKLFGAAGAALEAPFLELLAVAQSNVTEDGTGADIYHRRAARLRVDIEQVAAHFAVSSVFRNYPEQARVYAFEAHCLQHQVQNSGRARLVSGEVELRSMLTHEHERLFYTVLHFGDQNVAAGVKRARRTTHEAHTHFAEQTGAALLRADLPGVIRLFDSEFEGRTYTVRALFADEQRAVMKMILNNTVAEAEESLLRLYADHASLLHFLSQTAVPRPAALALAANFAVNIMLQRALAADPVDSAQIRSVLASAAEGGIDLDWQSLSFVADARMREVMLRCAAAPEDRACLEAALALAQALRLLPFAANIWQAQNVWHELAAQRKLGEGSPSVDHVLFESLGSALGFSVENYAGLWTQMSAAAHAHARQKA